MLLGISPITSQDSNAKETIMVASISSSTVSNWSDSLFNKLDTKKQGYVDASDLATALGTDSTDTAANASDAADMMKEIDGDGDGKITQSELSTAISKVADQLNAQFDSSRVDKSQAGTPPDGPPPTPPSGATATTGADTTDSADSTDSADDALNVSASSASSTGGAKGAAPAGGGGSAASSTDTNKYVQAADTDANGTVSDDEAAAYKKLMAAQAEKSGHAHGHHGGGKAEKADSADSSTDSTSAASSSDQDLSRALDMLKQYVSNSGDSSTTSSSSSVSVTA